MLDVYTPFRELADECNMRNFHVHLRELGAKEYARLWSEAINHGDVIMIIFMISSLSGEVLGPLCEDIADKLMRLGYFKELKMIGKFHPAVFDFAMELSIVEDNYENVCELLVVGYPIHRNKLPGRGYVRPSLEDYLRNLQIR